MSYSGDLEHRIVSPRAHVARIFPERSFLFPALKRDSAFHDDLRRGGHLQVDGEASYDLDRFPADASRRREFIHSQRKWTDGGQAYHGIGAENDCRFGATTLRLI